MSRGLPWSVLLHAVVLTLVLVYGNHVNRTVVQPPRAIHVRMVRPEPAETPPADEPAPAPEPRVQPPEPEPLPPKEVPRTEPDRRPEPEPEPEEKPREPEPEPATSEDAPEEPAEEPPAAAQATVSGPSVSGTDTDFPFAWYLAQIEARIARNWRPRQLGFAERAQVSCAVHFVVSRSGTVSQVTLVRNSGVGVFDREALRAVQSARLGPLPPQYGGSTLGVTFTFNLEPRS